MKSEALALASSHVLAARQSYEDAVRELRDAELLPDDVLPPFESPSLTIGNVYYTGGPLCIELSVAGDYPLHLEYKGTDDNPAGPQEWTEIPIPAGGAPATHVMQNPAGQKILVRAFAGYGGAQQSEATSFQVNADDYPAP